MKATKAINARYNMDTGKWAIRDNGTTLASGQELRTYCEAVKAVKATAEKPVKETMK